jgi:hypothetical protein
VAPNSALLAKKSPYVAISFTLMDKVMKMMMASRYMKN